MKIINKYLVAFRKKNNIKDKIKTESIHSTSLDEAMRAIRLKYGKVTVLKELCKKLTLNK